MDLFKSLDVITPVIKKSLEKIKIEGADTLRDEKKYKERIVDPAWELVPFAIRFIGRDRLKWDLIFNKLRTSAFIIEDEKVEISTAVLGELQEIIKGAWKQ